MALVGTWNLENLYRPGGEFGPPDEATYRAKLEAVAQIITAEAPDALAVQEVGEPEALDDLVAVLGSGWSSVLSAFPDDRGIRVGFLSRTPAQVVEDVADFPQALAPVQAGDGGRTTGRMGRSALAVRVAPADGPPLDLVTCHLKSKLLSFPPRPGSTTPRFSTRDEGERARAGAYALYLRAAEAVTVRALADRLLGGDGREHAVVVLGDLNDEPAAATTQILLGPPGSELGTAGADVPDRGDGARLWNLAPRIPAEQRFTRVYRGRRELIDHILVSRALLDAAQEVRTVSGESRILSRADGPPRAAPRLPSIADDPSSRRATGHASDHAMVLARFGS